MYSNPNPDKEHSSSNVDPEKLRDFSDCFPIPGWKDYDTSRSGIQCGEDQFTVGANPGKQGGLDPAFHRHARVNGGPGSVPMSRVPSHEAVMQRDPMAATDAEKINISKHQAGMGPEINATLLSYCTGLQKQFASTAKRTKNNMNHPAMKSLNENWNTVCEDRFPDLGKDPTQDPNKF